MKTNDKTLADVQPGGRVRLGDALPPLPPEVDAVRCMIRGEKDLAEACDYYYTAEQMRDYARAALAAQPSPGGQGDARAIIEEFIQCATLGRPYGKLIAQAKDYLAARQPVGEPIGWYTEDHLTDRSATTYDRTIAERWRAKGWPVYPLYGAPPVLFKELEKLRELQAMIGGQADAHG